MVEKVKESRSDRARRRRELRKELIIAAAVDELGEVGVNGVTLSSVGERVGLSKGALYYYVDGRDSLLALVLDDALQAIRRTAVELAGDDRSALLMLNEKFGQRSAAPDEADAGA